MNRELEGKVRTLGIVRVCSTVALSTSNKQRSKQLYIQKEFLCQKPEAPFSIAGTVSRIGLNGPHSASSDAGSGSTGDDCGPHSNFSAASGTGEPRQVLLSLVLLDT